MIYIDLCTLTQKLTRDHTHILTLEKRKWTSTPNQNKARSHINPHFPGAKAQTYLIHLTFDYLPPLLIPKPIPILSLFNNRK